MVKAIKNIMRERGSDSNLLHVVTDEERQKLQKILLGMFLDVEEVCKRLNIECTLIGGSVLGAVRHQGFIPWDDDLDIGMTRRDWEKFKANFQSLLGEKYAMEGPNFDNKDTKQLLTKIYLKGTEWVMIEEVNFPFHNCIYIDVFIIDSVSDNKLVSSFDAFLANVMRAGAISLQEYKYPSPILKEAMMSKLSTRLYYYIRQTVGFCFSIISHKALCDMFDSFVSRHREGTKRATVATGLKKYKGETLDYDVWFPFSRGMFCGHEVNLPHDSHRYLTEIYGNYMQLPPVEKRETHPVVRLKFPD